jgi:RNA polymerase sigma-70 factor, ECF subfamily
MGGQDQSAEAEGHWRDKEKMSISLSNPLDTENLAAERELVARIRAGEKDLYYDLVSPHERKAYVMAFSVLHDVQEAEDCVQDAVLKAFRHLDQFRGESKFGSWLIRIVINEARMRLRKLRPRMYESLDEPPKEEDRNYVPVSLGDWREIPSEALERKEIRDAIEEAVGTLSNIYRDVFVLRDVEGHDIASTAQILGISEESVKTRLLRARLRLRDLLAPKLGSKAVLSRNAFQKGKNPWL